MPEPKITTARVSAAELRTELLVLHVFERDRSAAGFVAKVDRLYDGAISRILESGDFAGRKNDTLVVYPPDPSCGIRRVLLVGAGKREDHTVRKPGGATLKPPSPWIASTKTAATSSGGVVRLERIFSMNSKSP
jgi:hypothetical protein